MARKNTTQKAKERLVTLLNEAIATINEPDVKVEYYSSQASIEADNYYNLSFKLKREPNYLREG